MVVPHLYGIRVDHHACFRVDALGPETRSQVGECHADPEHAVGAIDERTHVRIAQSTQVNADILRVALRKC